MVSLEEKEEQHYSLVARAKTGDINAFEQLFTRYQNQVFRTAFRLLSSREDAADATQEVFLKLHKYLHNFNEERQFSPWLYQVTVNVCREIAAKRKVTLSIDEEICAALSFTPVIDKQLDQEQERKIIAEAIQTLPEKERAAIILRDIEGLDTKEVARLLGSSEATVRSQISMARVKIKKYRDRKLNLK
ncbi:MAG: sigma-70 family RNA polymerase sigma factor [Blastocatellia bacterium]|nr:sigma-70 family RNA polymerase sigma factor [Blastocatellia bacterium]